MGSFVAHPAMAAAATLVVVVGVAGVVYLRRGGEHLMEAPSSAIASSADETASRTVPLSSSAPAPAPPPATEPAPPPPAAAVPAPEVIGGGYVDRGSPGAGSSGYRVGLSEEAKARDVRSRDEVDKGADADRERVALRREGERADPLGKVAPFDGAPAKQKRPAGIELRTPELQPKDLSESKLAKKDSGKRESAQPYAADDTSPPAADQVARAPAPQSGAAGAAAPAPAPLRSPPPRPQATTRAQLDGVPGNAVNGPSYRFGDAKNKSAAAGKPADEKTGDDPALFGWARKQHDQVLAAVGAGECRKAATAAVEIYNRTPGYFAANVVNDRSVRPCLPYITSERQREDNSRAAKRANAAEAPTQAAPPPPARK
jgi:hypothetical protein